MTDGRQHSHTRARRQPSKDQKPRPLAKWVTPGGLITVFVGVAAGLILTGWDRGRGWYDQHYYHEPTIRAFANQWPHFDLGNYWSATTPGYHLALAAVA